MTSKNPFFPLLAAPFLAVCLWLNAPDAQARTYTTYEQALEDLDESRYEKAEEKLKQVIAQDPNNAAGHAELGRVYMNTDNLRQMEVELSRAIELNDKLCRAYAYRAYMYWCTRRPKEALADSKKALDLYMVNPLDWSAQKVLANRALAYDRMGRRAEAAADREKEKVFVVLDEAGKFREVGRLPEALKRVDKGLALEPTNADLWFFRGVVNANSMKFWDAIADFNRALRYAPQATMLYYFRGDCYDQVGKYQQAIDDYTRVIKAGEPLVAYRFVCESGRLRNLILRDDTVCVSLNDVYILRAEAKYRLGKLQSAIKDFDYVVAHDKTDDRALARRAEVVAGMGKSDESIKDFTRAINSNKSNWENYVSRAQALLKLGKDEEAIADLSEVIKLNPKDPGAYVLRATVYKQVGRYENAVSDCSRALEIKADSDLLLERADCLRALRKYDEALKDLDHAVSIDKHSISDARALKAKILQEQGEDEKARVELQELEKQAQEKRQKSETSNIAIYGGSAVFVLGLCFLGFRAWRKRGRTSR